MSITESPITPSETRPDRKPWEHVPGPLTWDSLAPDSVMSELLVDRRPESGATSRRFPVRPHAVLSLTDPNRAAHVLQWAESTIPDGMAIVAVHATSIPISVHNGPRGRSVDGAFWSTVHQRATAVFGSDRVYTVVEHGTQAELLTRYSMNAELVALGAAGGLRFRRLRRFLEKQLTCPIIVVPT